MINQKDGGTRRYRATDMQFKLEEMTGEGVFTGYASVFGVVDSYREVVAPGAFTESLAAIKAAGRTLPALWHHQVSEPIGGYDELMEDERGLYVRGYLLKDEIPQAAIAYATMKRSIVSGLSIGYYVEGESWNEKDRILTLTKVDLREVSVVTFPANDEARIDAVRSKLAHGGLPSLREFEQAQRELGFSRVEAAAIAARGFRSLLSHRGDLGDGGMFGEFIRSARDDGGFVLPTF